MTLTFLHLCCAVILMVTCLGVHGFEWTSGLPDFSVKYACHGGLLQLPWNYSSAPGDSVISIRWFFKGVSEQLIAFSSPPHFAPMASFSTRVQRHSASRAGIVLSHVTRGDTGNYSVRVSGHTASGTAFTFNRTVLAHILEENTLLTTDGELHAMLEPQAIYSNTTGQWSLVVSCGHFTFPGDPPFNMEWTTPSGAVVPSDGYKDGYFQLHVTSGGDYTCTIPQHAAADLCLHNATRHATVHVDRMEARMTLMEARQQQLTLKSEQLEQENGELKQRDTNLTDYVHTLESRLDNKDSSLTQSLQTLASKVSRQVAFTALLRRHHTSGGTIKFDLIINNYGNSYNPSSGLFTAPVDGLYFFTVTSSPLTNNDYPQAVIYGGGSHLCVAASNRGMEGRVASCGAAVHLTAGQTVHVGSSRHLTSSYTSFSGFLVTSD